jgi:hypothetical protein
LNESNIKPIISLRTDIFNGLQVHQREKYQDLILKVDWTKELLKEFIVKRILTVYNDIDIENDHPLKDKLKEKSEEINNLAKSEEINDPFLPDVIETAA